MHWQLQININNTQKLPGTNLATPESFIPIDPTNEKLINNLISTEKMLTTWPPGTPRGASNQKTKKYLSLKIYFRRGTFNKELQNSEKIAPSGSPLITQKLGHPKVTANQPNWPWKFCSDPFTWSKVIHDFLLHRQTDTQTPYKTNHPSSLFGCRWKCFSTLFFYLSQNGMSEQSELTPYFWINKKSKQKEALVSSTILGIA